MRRERSKEKEKGITLCSPQSKHGNQTPTTTCNNIMNPTIKRERKRKKKGKVRIRHRRRGEGRDDKPTKTLFALWFGLVCLDPIC